MRSSVAPALIIGGLILIGIGLLAWTGLLSWFGRLPGDIRIERPSARVYIPITSMIVLSIAFSVLLAIIRRFR